MITFDDFDAWGDAVSGASLQLACVGIEQRQWTLGAVDLGDVLVQMATEGGGTICYGANTHVGPTLFVPITHAAEHVVNGVALDDASCLAIPRGADFSIHVQRHAHAWCSIALPSDVPAPAASTRIDCGTTAIARLRRLAGTATMSLAGRQAGTAAHRAAARRLQAAASACLHVPAAPRSSLGRPRLDRSEIIRRAMAAIEAATIAPTAAELAENVGVTGRTLLRTFRESFGVPPKQYLMLRVLHAVHRTLGRGVGEDATVADVLTRHGIWEFGRFASRYRRQFGELPSETLARARA